ncbi:MAG TPA: glycogen debranching enzyme N-terminal domain-containing protein, partial [Anaerolineae bacterium]|nr:glycogen debranching enzyme N-terminal domain-containing protein [Anaerolineae bacterium]
MLDFGRVACGDLAFSGKREWLVTNGMGGYAMGTVSGVLTRRYHGLLVAALQPPVARTLLVTKLDESVIYDGENGCLYADRRAGGKVAPQGFVHLERFFLEGAAPVWRYAVGDELLEKRVWMEQGANTTYVLYRLTRASGPLRLRARALVNYRDHHGSTRGMQGFRCCKRAVESVAHGLRVGLREEGVPVYLLSSAGEAVPEPRWLRGYFLSEEAYQGLDELDDHVAVGRFDWTLQPGESVTLVATTEPDAGLDGAAAYARQRAHEERLLGRARPHLGPCGSAMEQLVLAADQFVVQRPIRAAAAGEAPEGHGRSVIAGYPWFGDWGRDTMISLPGLSLATGRFEVAAQILRTFAHYVSQGMLPNRFPDEGQA